MLPQHGLVCAQFTHLPLHLALFSSPILNILSESAKLPHTPKGAIPGWLPPGGVMARQLAERKGLEDGGTQLDGRLSATTGRVSASCNGSIFFPAPVVVSSSFIPLASDRPRPGFLQHQHTSHFVITLPQEQQIN
ncbi:hypothetical protein TgHK011_000615 [Trichoderma gracile]|nr:hypothetical protein TgHK011_000615 [Trichoderma gracile]